jgi:hypothetical protein
MFDRARRHGAACHWGEGSNRPRTPLLQPAGRCAPGGQYRGSERGATSGPQVGRTLQSVPEWTGRVSPDARLHWMKEVTEWILPGSGI